MRTKSSGESAGLPATFTAIPNALIDEVMPRLKDTEWRLLCVIARQTLGWVNESGERKRRDWMSQSQLIAKTGRNSAALSAALDVLVREDLIECQTENGQPLSTPQQRRRHRGRVYFSLRLERMQPAKSELQKANWTKERQNKRKSINMEADEKVRPFRPYSGNKSNSGWTAAGEIAKNRGYKDLLQ